MYENHTEKPKSGHRCSKLSNSLPCKGLTVGRILARGAHLGIHTTSTTEICTQLFSNACERLENHLQ